jgi:hypothetical protein
LPKPAPAFISLANGIVVAMTNNPTFPTPTPALAVVSAALTDLEAANAAAQARTRGAAANRRAKQAALATLLEELKVYVQKIADATPANSAAIIASAGMGTRKIPAIHKRVFSATPGTVSGTMKLVTDAAAPRASYEWQSSIDGGKTWVALPTTLQAKTTVLGLTPGATVTFRYRAVTKTGEGDWAQPISAIVK